MLGSEISIWIKLCKKGLTLHSKQTCFKIILTTVILLKKNRLKFLNYKIKKIEEKYFHRKLTFMIFHISARNWYLSNRKFKKTKKKDWILAKSLLRQFYSITKAKNNYYGEMDQWEALITVNYSYKIIRNIVQEFFQQALINQIKNSNFS